MSSNRRKGGSVAQISEGGRPDPVPYIAFGTLSVVYGITVFVFLPIALLSFNLGLMLSIFFFILLGMIYGLSLLATNIQPTLEILVVKVILCWEKVSMKNLILKNLIAHRRNNIQTAIIYSLTIGSVIFLYVSLAMQL